MIGLPAIDTSNVRTFTRFWGGCYSLVCAIPIKPKTNIIDALFQNCSSLVTIPPIDTSAATNLSNMFRNCYKLRLKSLGKKYPNNTSYKNIYGGSAVVEITTDDMSETNDIGGLHDNCLYLKKIKYNFTSSVLSFNNMFTGTRNIEVMTFYGETSFAGVNRAGNNFTTSNENSIPKTCVNYNMCTQLFNTMLRGVPAYSAHSYPMYFESGSTVDDDAAGTLQSLVEQCQAMGWAIYNLTINPYTE